jgi:hypothetical protein
MVLISLAGMTATQLGAIGESEPRLVLQLSWAALLFAGLDGVFVTDKE